MLKLSLRNIHAADTTVRANQKVITLSRRCIRIMNCSAEKKQQIQTNKMETKQKVLFENSGSLGKHER